ncbi:MAG: (2Fe-2S)-binding protein [Spirochaetales bacterium]
MDTFEDMEEMICPCYDLKLKDIVKAIKEQNITTVEELGEVTGAGTLCGSCLEDLEEIIKKYANK